MKRGGSYTQFGLDSAEVAADNVCRSGGGGCLCVSIGIWVYCAVNIKTHDAI
jgi:hypothetical protein